MGFVSAVSFFTVPAHAFYLRCASIDLVVKIEMMMKINTVSQENVMVTINIQNIGLIY